MEPRVQNIAYERTERAYETMALQFRCGHILIISPFFISAIVFHRLLPQKGLTFPCIFFLLLCTLLFRFYTADPMSSLLEIYHMRELNFTRPICILGQSQGFCTFFIVLKFSSSFISCFCPIFQLRFLDIIGIFLVPNRNQSSFSPSQFFKFWFISIAIIYFSGRLRCKIICELSQLIFF